MGTGTTGIGLLGRRDGSGGTVVRLPALRRLRQARGFSQVGLAVRAGVTPSTVIQLEHGARGALPATAVRLAAVLDVSLADLAEV